MTPERSTTKPAKAARIKGTETRMVASKVRMINRNVSSMT